MSASAPSRKVVSSLGPHHEVCIEYPCYDLLKDGEIMAVLQTANIKSRYQPLPLVPEPSIDEVFPFKSLNDTVRASYYPAKAVFDPSTFPFDEDTSDRKGSLATDMAKYSDYLGRTTLKVLTFIPNPDHEEDQPKFESGTSVRIRRVTRLRREDGDVERLPHHIYDSTVGTWTNMVRDSNLSRTPLQPWQLDVYYLMHQSMEYDVRHVQIQLEAIGHDYDEVINSELWKRPRQLPISQGIAKIATIMTKPELDSFNKSLVAEDKLLQCPSCLEDYDESAANRPVLLPCSKKHCLCFTCTGRWCIQIGLDQVTCPYCRQRLMPDHLMVSMQPNYLDIDAPFSYDRRFNDFENTERAFAPLDRVCSRTDETMIVVDHDVMIEAWNMIIPVGWNDTILRMIPLNAPESWILNSVKQEHGKTMPAKDVFTALCHGVLRPFAKEFIANGMGKYVCAELRADLIDHALFVPLRPGFDTFVRRTLNRVIQLTIQRACYDHGHRKNITETNPKGWHAHGLLAFWCPEDGAIVPAQAGPEQQNET